MERQTENSDTMWTSSMAAAVHSRVAIPLSSPYPLSAKASMQLTVTTGDMPAIMLLQHREASTGSFATLHHPPPPPHRAKSLLLFFYFFNQELKVLEINGWGKFFENFFKLSFPNMDPWYRSLKSHWLWWGSSGAWTALYYLKQDIFLDCFINIFS